MSKSTVTLSNGVPVTVSVGHADKQLDGGYDVRVRLGAVCGNASVEESGRALGGSSDYGDWLSKPIANVLDALPAADRLAVCGEISALAEEAIRAGH